MPRRVITLGLQPSTFSFQDDHGPLVNGLASAAQSFFEGGQRRAELEMAREEMAAKAASEQDAVRRQIDRDLMGDNLRKRELDLRKTEIDDRRAASVRDDLGGLAKGVATFLGLGKADKAQPEKPVPSYAFDAATKANEQTMVGEGNLVPVLDSLGSPTGKYTPKEGFNPALAHQAGLIMQGIDPSTGMALDEAGKTAAAMRLPVDLEPADINDRVRAAEANPLASAVADDLAAPAGEPAAAPVAAPIAAPSSSVMQPPGMLTRTLGAGTEEAYAAAGIEKNGFAAVQEMRNGSGFIDVRPGTPWYTLGVSSLARLDPGTREAEIRAILARDPAYAKQVITDLLAAGVQ